MNRYALIFLIIITNLLPTYAQNQPITFGIEIGVNNGKFDFSNEEEEFLSGFTDPFNFSAEFGYSIGIFGAFRVAEKVQIESGLLYNYLNNEFGINARGGSSFPLTTGGTVIRADGKVERKTLSLPVLFKFFPDKKINIDVGPSYEFTLKNDILYNNPVRTEFLDISERDKSEFGLNAKVNIAIAKKFLLRVKYNYLTKTKALMGTLSIGYQIN